MSAGTVLGELTQDESECICSCQFVDTGYWKFGCMELTNHNVSVAARSLLPWICRRASTDALHLIAEPKSTVTFRLFRETYPNSASTVSAL